MASRMERYQQQEGRSSRNKRLYKNIRNLDNYTNIEGVVSIDKTNEIDITRVKEMLQNREGYQKEKQYRQLVSKEEEEPEEFITEEEEDRTYDIRDVLTKAKETRIDPDDKYRVLKNNNYDIIKKLNLKTTPEEEEVLKELIDTITIRTQVEMEKQQKKEGSSKGQTSSDDLGLLDDLKSDTMVGDATSIKSIIDEAKAEAEIKKEEEVEDSSNLENLDKSFYTSSLGFTESDFEDLKSLGEDIKRHNVLLRILIISITIVVLMIVIFAFLSTF